MINLNQMQEEDTQWMKLAISEARRCLPAWPFGAVIIYQDEAVAQSADLESASGDITQHAEMVVLSIASRQCGIESLRNMTLYTTHEPCAMCSGAIINAKLARCVIGSSREELHKVFHQKQFRIETLAADGGSPLTIIERGVCRDECISLFNDIKRFL
jgi:tRNA(Arg) A34 adenosine deaminase TadA